MAKSYSFVTGTIENGKRTTITDGDGHQLIVIDVFTDMSDEARNRMISNLIRALEE